MSNIAIYARKSVFREDSISIESQIEMCKYEARGEECIIYQDNGFSEKNTDRPDFKRMMSDINLKKISKELDHEKRNLSNKIKELRNKSNSPLDFKELHNVISKWDDLPFDKKRDVVELLIERIVVYFDRIEIIWKV